MASKETIFRAFQTFVALELRETPSTPEAVLARLAVWTPLMPDVTDAEFEAAVVAYLRDPTDSEFFPRTPGKLLKYRPSKGLAAGEDADEVFTKAMRYMIDHPPRWMDPESGPVRQYFTPDAAPGLVPVPYPKPPWTEDQAEAVTRATAAMGGVEAWSLMETGSFAEQEAARVWKRVYRSARKELALGIESGTVGQITSGSKQIERSP